MICLISGNKDEAETWASGQNLSKNEWFFPTGIGDLMSKSNFHVLVIGSAGMNVSTRFFDSIYNLAQQRGKIGRA